MKNEEAISAMRNLMHSLNEYYGLSERGQTAFRMAITALEGQKWIPAEDKERLPREGQRVLVTDEDGEIEIAHIVDYSDIGEDIEWWSHDYKCHPIAWCECPKPYERSADATD